MFLPGTRVKSMGEGIKLPVINGLGRTNRIDNWWSQPLTMGVGLTAALLYTFWRLFLYGTEAADGTSLISYKLHGSTVMSPIFSPNVLEWDLFGLSSWNHPEWVNAAILHRYFLYAAMVILVIKWWDVTHTMHFESTTHNGYGVSIGTFVMAIEAFLLTMYVTSCHALRHLAGGMLDRWTTGISRVRGQLFGKISVLNRSHGFWFWTSLAFVFLGDLWVLAVAEGRISDAVLFVI
jgi:hypothetical protein